MRQPRTVALLALSAASVSTGWVVFVWAVNHGKNIESSLGYYINPLMNMAVGAACCSANASTASAWHGHWPGGRPGVAVQTLALGHPPVIALILATTFWIYGLIRRQVDAEALGGPVRRVPADRRAGDQPS